MSHHTDLLEKATAIEINELPLQSYIDRLKKWEPFKFARYGDGEWTAIMNPDPTKGNCDGHPYSYELSADLAKSIVEPSDKIEYGIQALSVGNMGDAIKAYVGPSKIEWTNADVFHTASEARKLGPFADALRERGPIIVGARQWNNGKWLKPKAFIQVPNQGVYSYKNEIIELIRKIPMEGQVILLACSMLAEVIIYELRDTEATIIDIGSVFDPWLGILNRGYHEKLGELDPAVLGDKEVLK